MSTFPSIGGRCRWLGKSRLFLSSLILGGLASLSPAATFTAANSTDLTNLLTSTSLGDTIILNAGATYTGTFTLPNKTGSGYVTIQSSALASLPAGVRVSPANAASMPKIIPGNSASSAIRTAAGAHHYKLLGIEFISFTAASSFITNDLIVLGDGLATTTSGLASDIVIDRCIVRASTDTQRIKRGIMLNAIAVDVTNSYIAGFKDTGSDTQAIGGVNGPGPFNIINNYLEAACENIMFGGDVVRIPNLVPSDIIIKKNHINKKKEWNKNRTTANGFSAPIYAGIDYSVKNLIEFKMGQRVVVEGNVFENHWQDSQAGWAFVFTPIPNGAANPWAVVQDIEFSKNIMRNIPMGPNITGHDDDWPTEQTKRLKFVDNLIYNVGGLEFGGTGVFCQTQGGTANFTFNHNTTFYNGSTWILGSGPVDLGWIITNNIFPQKTYGVKRAAQKEAALAEGWPDVIFTKNVIQGASLSNWDLYNNNFNPQTDGYPALFDTVFASYNNGVPNTNFAGWKVKNPSPYFRTGLKSNITADGRDAGCDIDALNAATAGSISGVWPTALIAQDSFIYTGSLNGQNGGTGFGTNAWVQVAGANNPAIATGTMTYTDGTHTLISDMISGGNKVQPAANSRATRNFPSPLSISSKTYWVSFRMRQTGASFPSNHAGFSLFAGAAGSGTEIFLGKGGSTSNWGIYHSGTGQSAVATGTPSMDAFLVCKLVFTGTQVSISMWVNPILSEALLGTPQAQLLNQAHTTTLASLRLSTGTNSTGYQFDEFRIGTGFQDVTD